MADLLWGEVKPFFDPDANGYLPDGSVQGCSVPDWQAVFDLVRSRGWTFEYSEGETVTPLPSARQVFAREQNNETACVRVWLVPEVQVIFWLFRPDMIDFDVDVRELQGQQRLNILCDFLRNLGQRLGKSVTLTFEGTNTDPLLGYDHTTDRINLLASNH